MSPEKTTKVNGQLVEQFYWAGEYPVYVDHRLVCGSFSQVVEMLQNGITPIPGKSRDND